MPGSFPEAWKGREWREYAGRLGFKIDLCTQEYRQCNGLIEKFMRSIVKVTHAAIAEKNYPRREISSFLMTYRNNNNWEDAE